MGYCYASYLQKTEKTIDAKSVINSNKKSAVKITGFRVQAVILSQKEGVDTTLDCGLFELDDSSYTNSTMKIKATSLPYASPIRQRKKSKAWEGYTLRKIAGEITAANNMGLIYSVANDPLYKRREQVQCSDIAFLQGLCTNAGLSLKVTANVLVIYDASEYEAKCTVLTIKRNDGSYTKPSLSSVNSAATASTGTLTATDRKPLAVKTAEKSVVQNTARSTRGKKSKMVKVIVVMLGHVLKGCSVTVSWKAPDGHVGTRILKESATIEVVKGSETMLRWKGLHDYYTFDQRLTRRAYTPQTPEKNAGKKRFIAVKDNEFKVHWVSS